MAVRFYKRFGFIKGYHDLICGIFVTDKVERAIFFNEPISGLQFGDAELVYVPDACTLVIGFPAIVAPFDPAALFRF